MARVMVGDCLAQIPNRYELALLAAERARQLAAKELKSGAAVSALREIAQIAVSADALREALLRRLRGLPEQDVADVPDDSFSDLPPGTQFAPPAYADGLPDEVAWSAA